jgi:hypothetical protein
MRDFTFDIYCQLLSTLQEFKYSFFRVNDFIVQKEVSKNIILRHDVDLLPLSSLKFAEIQNQRGVFGTYYFRIINKSFNDSIIRRIASMGHEIGYHYETMYSSKGNVDKAYDEFCQNLEIFRKIVPIETVCMHGSPLSKYDNRLIWNKYDYKKLGILTESSMDIDFNKVFYITDTGRMWDGVKLSIRDKPRHPLSTKWPSYHSTVNIVTGIKEGSFPNNVMMTFHPQRWTNNPMLWTKELLIQNLKNQVKKVLLISKSLLHQF